MELDAPLHTSESRVPGGATSPWTYNVMLGLAATSFYGIGPGLYQYTVLPTFILVVGGNNFGVGFAEGLQGTANMISALPAGYLADKLSRKACIRLGCCLQLVGSVCMLIAICFAHEGSFPAFVMLCASLCLQGVCDGIVNGPLQALMDDSCPAGRRSDVETANSIVGLVSASVGPILGLFVFIYPTGNHWALHTMKYVIGIGVVFGQLSLIPAWLMDDRRALGEQSEAVHLQARLTAGVENDSQQGEARELVARQSRAACCGLVTMPRVRCFFSWGTCCLLWVRV
ncbi:unnamed protein product [Prorocentrum cordatum]|uniref:Major facilitator superfamily (MFS) profile domain-containing protein n=1 Tax=Prorocentrum cordatum TaxID=2364126 RepID=A0ABN9U2D9_9DINO|nr:unnamed protein product [Polarella glacialis]